MNKALASKMSVTEVGDFLFQAINTLNYVPPQAKENYKQALRNEYEQRQQGTEQSSDELEVKVFGTGCITCDKLEAQIFDILAKLGLAADIEKVFDLDDIWRHGVLTPPALKINGKIVCQGKMPTPVEIEQWLQE